jgi:sigma-54 dependent transcriptional regulator, acetoin dehydrogenase operon transcriptional activator AcoR
VNLQAAGCMSWFLSNKISINKKIYAGFGLVLVFLVAIGAVSYSSMNRLVETVHWEVHAHKVLNQLHDLLFQLQNAETGQRGYVLTGETRYLEPYRTAMRKTDREISALRALMAHDPDRRRRLSALERLVAEKFAELEQTIALRQAKGFDAALQVVLTDRGKRIMDDIRLAIDRMEGEVGQLLRQREIEAERSMRNTLLIIGVGILLAFGLVTLASVLISRDLSARKRAQQAVKQAYDELELRIKERTAQLAQVNDALQLKIVEGRHSEQRLAQSRDDMLSILNQLRAGTVKTDADGRIVFLSRIAQVLFDRPEADILGKRWEQALPFEEQDRVQLRARFAQSPGERAKVPVHLAVPGGKNYWMEIDVQDDPRDPRAKIFFLYDVSEVYDLRCLVDEKAQLQELIGKSKPIRLVYQQIRTLANVDSTVLIEGETGTGKELVARAIHALSRRRDKPFIPVNSAGLTESLLSSQLFGHKRGAFTGAVQDHRGIFEAAAGGTLFLDEIGDISINVQASLLRVLQEKEITRLGESKPRKIDIRVIAASQRELNGEVAQGRFRADLLYRIRVARIVLPPLRERREDIPLLVAWFLDHYRAATGKPVREVRDEAMRVLLEYPWPGNIRELRSAIEFAVIGGAEVIGVEDLPPEILQSSVHRMSLPGARLGSGLDEKQRLLAALEQAGHNRTLAARLLGVSRATFYRRLASLNIPLH